MFFLFPHHQAASLDNPEYFFLIFGRFFASPFGAAFAAAFPAWGLTGISPDLHGGYIPQHFLGIKADIHWISWDLMALWKNDGVKVSWDDFSIPNWMESHTSHVPNHQPVYVTLRCQDTWL